MFKTKRAITAGLIGVAGWVLFVSCQAIDSPEWTPPAGRVLFGIMAPFTGVDAEVGTAAESTARLAINEINAAGGIRGQQIDAITADDRCDSDTAPIAAQGLLNRGVVALIGGVCSAPTLSAIDSVLSRQRPPIVMLSPTATAPALSGSYLVDGQSYFFRIQPSDTKQARLLARLVASAGIKTVNLMYVGMNSDGSPNLYGTGLYQGLTGSSGSLAANGVSVVGTPVSYPEGTTQFSSTQISQLFSGNPQAVILISYPLEAAGISRAIARFSPASVGTVKLFSTDAAYDPALLSNADVQAIQGMTGTSPGPDPSNPNYQKFVANYEAVVGKAPPPVSETAYDAVYILAYAAVKGGALTSRAMEPNVALVTGGTSPSGATDSGATVINVGEFAKGAAILQAGGNIIYSGVRGAIQLDSLGDPTRGTYTIWQVNNDAFVTLKTVTE